jgi:hypothetical protein
MTDIITLVVIECENGWEEVCFGTSLSLIFILAVIFLGLSYHYNHARN